MYQQLQSDPSNPHQFFAVDDNLFALKKATLMHYCQHIAPFEKIIKTLQENGLFDSVSTVDYSINDFFTEFMQPPTNHLRMLLPELLAKPLPEFSSTTMPIPADFPEALQKKIEYYIALIVDVLSNQLAQKPYEQRCDQENVTERQHALQAGKICLLIGLPLDETIAMLLHDIARPSIDNAAHGHIHHCTEGSTILKPLGLSIDYAGLHAFAKYLLFNFCPDYKTLISTTSHYSLKIQSANLAQQIESLKGLSSNELAKILYKIMFMRLIDDMSKVPEQLLQNLCDGEVKYFDNATIKTMLHKQIYSEIARLSADPIFETNLDQAMELLLRAKSFSLNPSLYECFEPVIEQNRCG